MNTLNVIPLALNFSRTTRKGIKYINQTHYMQFDSNSIRIRPILDSINPIGNITEILDKFKVTLRKYKLKNNKKLKLCFHGCPQLDRMLLQNLSKEFARHFKDLRELNIQFFICDDLTDDGIEYFFRPITKHIKRLKTLNLSINCCQKISNKGLEHIAWLVIRNCRVLDNLSINLSGTSTELECGELLPFGTNLMKRMQKIGDNYRELSNYKPVQIGIRGVLSLSKSIAQHLRRNLQHLSLTFPYTIATDPKKGNKIKKTMIQSLNNLKRLHISFHTFIDVADHKNEEVLSSVASRIGQSLQKLQYLSLDFSSFYSLTDNALRKIALNIFPNLKGLKGIRLDYEGVICTITDQGLMSFTMELYNYAKDLEELSYYGDLAYSITQSGMRYLIHHISRSFRALKRLRLGFGFARVDIGEEELVSLHTYQYLEQLCLYINKPRFGVKRPFENLKQLNLIFNDCTETTDEDFRDFVVSIFKCKLARLEELSMVFNDAHKISHKGFEILQSKSENWTYLENLKDFKLELRNCKKIDDASLERVSYFVQENMKNLRSLSLVFTNYQLITEAGTKSFIRNIVKIAEKLQDLYLNLFKDYQSSKPLLETLTDEIMKSSISGLRTLKVIFGAVNEVQENWNNGEVIRAIVEKLNFIPLLSIY